MNSVLDCSSSKIFESMPSRNDGNISLKKCRPLSDTTESYPADGNRPEIFNPSLIKPEEMRKNLSRSLEITTKRVNSQIIWITARQKKLTRKQYNLSIEPTASIKEMFNNLKEYLGEESNIKILYADTKCVMFKISSMGDMEKVNECIEMYNNNLKIVNRKH